MQRSRAARVVWIGLEALGTRDGRIALLPTGTRTGAHASPEREDVPSGAVHTAIVSHLQSFGASFFPDVYQGVGGGSTDDVVEAMWDLVWAGVVTNDSLAPLRGFTARDAARPNGDRT